MNIPSFLTMSKRIYLCALVVLTLAFAVSAQITEPTPNPSLNQHCANGDFGVSLQPCTYQNGNLNGQNSQWSEGEFVPMRVVYSDLIIGETYQLKISYDTTVGNDGKHAYDYLGTYTSTQSVAEGNDPCAGVAGCAIGDPDNDTYAIPIDPNVTAAGVTQIGGQFFTCFNCDITAVSSYTLVGDYTGASTTSIVITFVAKSTNPVIAFSGHVASRLDWGALNSAVAVNGSPYHWAVNDGPNRQMKVEAQGFPAKLTIIKQIADADGASELFFGFDRSDVGTAGQPDFFLQDDNDNTDGSLDRITINYPLALGGTQTVNITELAVGFGWSVSDIVCVDSSGGLGFTANSTPQAGAYAGGNTATANLQEAEFVTCTFSNAQATSTAAPASIGGRVTASNGRGLANVTVILTDAATSETVIVRTNTFGYYRFDNVDTNAFYSLTVASKRYSFPNPTMYFTLEGDMFDMNFVAE
jgi:hypothetical protein